MDICLPPESIFPQGICLNDRGYTPVPTSAETPGSTLPVPGFEPTQGALDSAPVPRGTSAYDRNCGTLLSRCVWAVLAWSVREGAMNWRAPAGIRRTIPVLVVATLLTGCAAAQQLGHQFTPPANPALCNCVVRIPVRPLDGVPHIVVHPLTKLAAKQSTAAPFRPSPPPPPPGRHHHHHPGH
jgi:hypothetical protein